MSLRYVMSLFVCDRKIAALYSAYSIRGEVRARYERFM